MFIIYWYSEKTNRWYKNTFKRWQDCEKRVEFLKGNNILYKKG